MSTGNFYPEYSLIRWNFIYGRLWWVQNGHICDFSCCISRIPSNMILQFNGQKRWGHQFEVLFNMLNTSTKRNDQTDLLFMYIEIKGTVSSSSSNSQLLGDSIGGLACPNAYIYNTEPSHTIFRERFFVSQPLPPFFGPKISSNEPLKNPCHKLLKMSLPGRVLFFVGSKASLRISDLRFTSGLPMRRRSVKIHPEIYLERWLWLWWRVLVSMSLWLQKKKKRPKRGKGKRLSKTHPVTSRVKVIVPPFLGVNPNYKAIYGVYRGPPGGETEDVKKNTFMSDVDNPAVQMALVFSKPGGWWTSYS